MTTATLSGAPAAPKLLLWAGRTITALFALFMVLDTIIKLMRLKVVDDSLIGLAYAPGLGFPVGVMEAIVLALYLIRRTSVLGAVLLTGVFGGAVASHLRAGSPVFTHVLFGVYLGALAWAGLWLRDESLRALLPVRR